MAVRDIAQKITQGVTELWKDQSGVSAPEPEPAAADGVPLCTKCGKNPRASVDSNNPWCTDCNTEYKRAYDASKLNRAELKAYNQGVQAMREHVANEFRQKISFGSCTGIEAADWVLACDGPKPPGR